MRVKISGCQREVIFAYGVISGLFFVFPFAIIALMAGVKLGEIFVSTLAFLVPLFFSGLVFANSAGRAVVKRKIWGFVLTFGSLIFSCACYVATMWALFPTRTVDVSFALELRVYVISVLTMIAFGCVPSMLAALLFIGGVERRQSKGTEAINPVP